jgi:hypothetical protein
VLTACDRPADAETCNVAMAGQLQRMLLPPSPFAWRGWTTARRYEPAGLISGDYVDLVAHNIDDVSLLAIRRNCSIASFAIKPASAAGCALVGLLRIVSRLSQVLLNLLRSLRNR